MKGLGKLSNRNGGLLITSHVSENKGEIAWVRELHPELPTYTSCYDDPGLLTPRTILAHGVYLDKEERALLRSRKSTVSHCPVSNCMLRSGMLNVRRMLEEGNSRGTRHGCVWRSAGIDAYGRARGAKSVEYGVSYGQAARG